MLALSHSDGPLRQLLASQRIRFLLVGGFNTLFGYGVFAALESALGDVAGYLIVLLMAHVISVLVAFVGYRRFVFKVHGRLLGDLVRFWSVYATVIALNAIALPLLVEGAGLPVLAAQAIFTVLTVISSYVAHGRYSFARPLPDPRG